MAARRHRPEGPLAQMEYGLWPIRFKTAGGVASKPNPAEICARIDR